MPDQPEPSRRRTVRSYVLRGGRLTPAQQRALEELYPRFGIPGGTDVLDPGALFGRRADIILEIGFGTGESTWRMALAEPGYDFIGVEVHAPGVGRLLLSLREHGLENVRVAMQDAVDFLGKRIPQGSLAGVRIYFPDPWPKKRHHKRRLIQSEFVALLADRMAPGAVLHLATDWQDYADHMLEVLGANPLFENLSPAGDWCERPPWRPATRYERRGGRLGHTTRDLLFQRVMES